MKIKDELLISAVSPEMVPVLWPVMFEKLEKAVECANGELDMEDVFSKMMNKIMLPIVISEGENIIAVIAVEVRDFDSGKRILNVTLAGGSKLDSWVALLDETLIGLARDKNCSEIYIVGRAGWQRAIKKYGYGAIHTVISKKVEEL